MAGSAERRPTPLILALETSCDDTCAAVVTRDGEVLANIRSSQDDLHARFGGVVPGDRVAAPPRAGHARARDGAGRGGCDARRRLRGRGTQGPGLIGALLVGLSTGKAVAYARRLPLVPVDHLLGHVAALRLAPLALEPPFACLLASGGHTLVLDVADYAAPRRLGGTRDDAAGEAFDKGARLLGLSEAGGAALELVARTAIRRASRSRRSCAARTARSLLLGTQDRAAAARARARRRARGRARGSRGELSGRDRRSSSPSAPRRPWTPAGGRAGRRRRRRGQRRAARCAGGDLRAARRALCLLPPALCVDNAAMIGAAAFAARALEPSDYLALDAYARSPLAG